MISSIVILCYFLSLFFSFCSPVSTSLYCTTNIHLNRFRLTVASSHHDALLQVIVTKSIVYLNYSWKIRGCKINTQDQPDLWCILLYWVIFVPLDGKDFFEVPFTRALCFSCVTDLHGLSIPQYWLQSQHVGDNRHSV